MILSPCKYGLTSSQLVNCVYNNNLFYYGYLILSAAKVGSCILSNTCLGLGVEVLSRLEQRLEGLQWSNIAAPLSADDDFNMAWVFGMLLIDAIGYMILSW